MNKLACLKAFVTVVESGGFSESARRLGVSKALISKQVAQLEDALGVRLFHRTTRRVSPTSSGQAYYEQGKPLLDELNDLDASMQIGDKALQGELRISAPTTFAEMHLLPLITLYMTQNPEVKLKLDMTDRFVNLVEERIDLAIRIGSLEESSLVSRRIGEIRLLLCASPSYIKTRGLPESLEAVSQQSCIVDSNNPDGNQWRLVSGNDVHTITVSECISVNSARAARDIVLAGNGIGYLPSFAIDGHIKRGELVQLLDDYTSQPFGIYAVYLHRKHLSPKVRRLMDLLIDNFQSTFNYPPSGLN
jgi:DNA-binding transcriptional LysR family regulator